MICVAGCVLTSLFLARALRRRPISLKGAIIRQDADTKKERPISEVEVTAAGELSTGITRSDSAGFFSVNLKKGIRRGQSISLTFRHPDYRPAEIEAPARDELLVVRMIPLRDEVQGKDARPPVVVSNVRARYSVNSTTTVNIGSAAKIFQVVNTANLPCKNAHGVFSGWEVESRRRIRVPGCRRRKRVSKCPGLVHCGSLSFF